MPYLNAEREHLIEAVNETGKMYKALSLELDKAKAEIERLREAMRPDNKLIGELAHMLTGLCNSVCCHRSGGFSHKEENCECRAVAAEIAEFYEARSALEEKE